MMSIVALVSGMVIMIGGTLAGLSIWAVPAGGILVGWLRPPRPAVVGALAGMLSWGGILVASWLAGNPVATVGSRLAGAMGLPGFVPLLVTLLLPAIPAASAAWLTYLVRPVRPADGRPLRRAA